MKKGLLFIPIVLVLLFSKCKNEGTDYEYKTTPNGLKYHFFHENRNGQPGNINDIYTFNATFYTANDSVYLQKEVRFLRTDVNYKGDFQEGLAMLKVGDSAVFRFAADTFYMSIGQKLPAFFKSGDLLTLKVGMVSILDPATFRIQMYEKEITGINEFIRRKNWNVILDSTGIRYEITDPKPDELQIQKGDTVDLTSIFWYTIEEKIITKGNDKDLWTIVVGDPKLQTEGLSQTLTFMRNGESVRTILPYSQAFGEEGNAWVEPFTTICIEFKVAGLRKKTNLE